MSVRWTNQFWSVSLEQTLFLDFLKLFENMRLAVSFAGKKMHFLDLQIKNYGCYLKFQGEVWIGRACAGANDEELTTCAKFWRQEVGGRGQREYQKGDLRRSSRRSLPYQCRRPLVAPSLETDDRLATWGCREGNCGS